ncbi:MAG: type II secretion system protein [Candidatus Sumerlaeota bacterium]|nr:type II secretion system protein [Candidatus Sumerlaeota bacterium]
MFRHQQHRASGFTLVETMVAVALVAISGSAVITAVLAARQWAEYDKQRLSAVAAARRYIEQRARHDLFPTLDPIADATIDNFNTPDTADDLMATLTMQLYHVNNDGTRGAELTVAPTAEEILEAVVTVSWNRTASLSSKRASETINTYVYPDL